MRDQDLVCPSLIIEREGSPFGVIGGGNENFPPQQQGVIQ